MSVAPIKPSEIVDAKLSTLPDEVILIFNEQIARNWNGSSATLKQNALIEAITERLNCSRNDVFAHHYLDVEDIYRREGWEVEYDKPAYNETYEATFEFSKTK